MFDILRGECLGNIWKFSIQKSGPILFRAAKSSIKPSLTHFTISTHRGLSTSHTLFSSKQFLPPSKSALFKHSRLLDLCAQTQVQMSFRCAPYSQCCLDKSREQRDGCLNLDKLPLRPVVRWDDDLGQDEELAWCRLHRKDIM